VAALARGGHGPRMATVFASEILDATVGGLTAWKHSCWRLTDPDAVLAAQMQRDAEAAQTLGFSVRWLRLPDAIYRGDRYTSDRELFGPLHDEEHARADHLSEERSATCRSGGMATECSCRSRSARMRTISLSLGQGGAWRSRGGGLHPRRTAPMRSTPLQASQRGLPHWAMLSGSLLLWPSATPWSIGWMALPATTAKCA
jgi:hypothetical protein